MRFYKKTIITRADNIPYLVRYSLFSCRWFAIKIHHILISDDDCLHDHPWAFISFILWGGYAEITKIKRITNWIGEMPVWSWFENTEVFTAGNVLYRKAEHQHRLFLSKPVWTFVITFKRVRDWGFWNSKGFTVWHKYISTGRRCD